MVSHRQWKPAWGPEAVALPSLELSGLDLTEPRQSETLKLYLREGAPEGYGAWLDRNLSQYDPIARSWSLRDSLPWKYRNSRSFKCWDDRCLHYIYGFSSQEERDHHVEAHSVLLKRDSGLSISDTPTMVLPGQSTHRRDHSNEHSRRYHTLSLPRPSGNVQLANASTPGLSRDHKDSLRSYSLLSEPSTSKRALRGSVDSEVDPLLPPLKRSRVGQSRLESIGELRLLTDAGPCLRCRILKQNVSNSSPSAE